MKGKWIIDLTEKVFGGEVSVRDGLGYFFTRFAPKPVTFSFSGIEFKNADIITWGIVHEVFIASVYTPPGFEIGLNDIVVDIGSHRGVFVSYAALRTNNTVLAFEPEEDNFSTLEELIIRQGFKNVEARRAAITGKTGSGEIYKGEISSSNSLTPIDYNTGKTLVDHDRVQLLSLKDALEQVDQVDLLKMDCEGAEFQIFENTDDETFNKIKRLSLEYHSNFGTKKLQVLIEVIEKHFSTVEVKDTPTVPLGYIYAKK